MPPKANYVFYGGTASNNVLGFLGLSNYIDNSLLYTGPADILEKQASYALNDGVVATRSAFLDAEGDWLFGEMR